MPRSNPTLNDRVRLERRGEFASSGDALTWDDGDGVEFDGGDDIDWSEDVPGDGAGNTQSGWFAVSGTLRAEIRELTGGETVLAAKLQGTSTCLVVLRASRLTRSITAEDRLIDLATDRPLNIRHAPPPGRDGYVMLTCEAGVASG